jgi:hypothetical protein
VRAQDVKRFVARGSEPSARQAERSGKQGSGLAAPTSQTLRCPRCKRSRAQRKAGFWGGSSHLPSAALPAVASPLQDKPSFVARGSEPSARQAELSGKRGRAGGSPRVPSASLSAAASRFQDKPSAAESGVSGQQPPAAKRFVAHDSEPSGRQLRLKIPTVGCTAAAIRESASARRLAERQLLLNVGVYTNEHRFV